MSGTDKSTDIDSKLHTRFFENSEWLTTEEAAIYLRKFSSFEVPSLNAIHQMVSRGTLRRRKFAGRLYFKKKELDYLIESSTGATSD